MSAGLVCRCGWLGGVPVCRPSPTERRKRPSHLAPIAPDDSQPTARVASQRLRSKPSPLLPRSRPRCSPPTTRPPFGCYKCTQWCREIKTCRGIWRLSRLSAGCRCPAGRRPRRTRKARDEQSGAGVHEHAGSKQHQRGVRWGQRRQVPRLLSAQPSTTFSSTT